MGAALVAMLVAASPSTFAGTLGCGADALGNTAAILCTAPSGPCDTTTVVVAGALDLHPGSGACRFDLGGRMLRVEGTVQTAGEDLDFFNAGDVVVAAGARLKCRGDFLQPDGTIDGGGSIGIASHESVRVAGLLDVSGYDGGEIEIGAIEGVFFEPSAIARANALAPLEEGEHAGSGGGAFFETDYGSITLQGEVSLRGQTRGAGGFVDLYASRDVLLDAAVDVSGSLGGELVVVANDRVTIRRSIALQSSGGGGDGGILQIDVDDGVGESGLVRGGSLEVRDATLDLRGSAVGGDDGSGGFFGAFVAGPIHLAETAAVHVDAGPSGEGQAGEILLEAGDVGGLDPEDGDILVAGLLSARGGRAGDSAGASSIELLAGRNLVVSGEIVSTGRDYGGDVVAAAGGAVLIRGPITAAATASTGAGGDVVLVGGEASDAGVTLASSVTTTGGAASSHGGEIEVAGCSLAVGDGASLNTRGGPAAIELRAHQHPMTLGAGSRYLAGAAGEVVVRYPAGAEPVVGKGVIFEPARTDVIVGPSVCPPPRCGNAIVEHGEQCDPGDLTDGDGCSSSCRVQCRATPAPDCRGPTPASGGRLGLVDAYDGRRDRLDWRWPRGAATSMPDLGLPTLEDDYVLCIYDESAAPTLILEATAPAGGLCGSRPCWQAKTGRGFKYRDPGAGPAGLASLSLKAGEAGKTAMAATGKGGNLALPALPLPLPLRVQLQTSHGACWEATFTTALANDATRFKARAD